MPFCGSVDTYDTHSWNFPLKCDTNRICNTGIGAPGTFVVPWSQVTTAICFVVWRSIPQRDVITRWVRRTVAAVVHIVTISDCISQDDSTTVHYRLCLLGVPEWQTSLTATDDSGSALICHRCDIDWCLIDWLNLVTAGSSLEEHRLSVRPGFVSFR